MRPLRLSLTAFGPYLETQNIDLRGFRYSRLFLIHGPVGSGKSFLLDGICCALYGRSSGGERDRQGMRCLQATPETDTVVVLDFEIALESYRVERRFVLHQEQGFEADDVTLWRLPSFGDPTRRDILSSSASGVEAMLTRLLGLSAEQFCQIAVLPQGQFRRFLLAPHQERQEIIGRMFDGQLYQRFTTVVNEEFELLKKSLAETWKEREELLERYKDTQGDPRERVWRSQEELQAVTLACQSHRDKSLEWERGLESAVRYETLERQREMSRRELEELLQPGESPEDGLSQRLRAALPDFRRWKELMNEAQGIAKELEEQRAQYEQLKSETNFLEAEVEHARRQEEEKYALLRTRERLEELAEEAAGISALDGELSSAQQRLQELSRLRSTLAAEVKRSQARAQSLEAELSRIEGAEERLLLLRQEVAELESREQQARQRQQLLATVEQARQREVRLREVLKGCKKELLFASQRQRAQQAQSRAEALWLLKPELTSGSPCPLCGATEHPTPFEQKQGAVTVESEIEQQILSLRERAERTEQELLSAKERRARFEGRLDGLPAGGSTEEGLGGLLERLRASLSLLEAKLAERQAHKEELHRISVELLPRRKKLRQMRLQRERLQATIEAASQLRQSRQSRWQELWSQTLGGSISEPEAWAGILEQEQARLTVRLAELEAVVYSSERVELMAETFALGLAETRAAERHRERLQAEADALQLALMEKFRLDFAGWADLSFALGREAREFHLSTDSVLDKETLVLAVRRQLDQTGELLSAVTAPEMRSEQIRHALGCEREQLELKMGRKAALQVAVETGARDVELYDSLVEKTRELETTMQSLAPLAAMISGDNALGLSFPEWVLERCFGRVLNSANKKLEVLAPQRFALVQERGLEVQVFDLQAGVARSAQTLSGGESFLASLALALGLGEVLQGSAQAGEKLGTLFIDEGFGYLDQQALDAALLCLENLRGEGRTIGIVSHVAELKERIRAQIVISGGQDSETARRVEVFAV